MLSWPSASSADPSVLIRADVGFRQTRILRDLCNGDAGRSRRSARSAIIRKLNFTFTFDHGDVDDISLLNEDV